MNISYKLETFINSNLSPEEFLVLMILEQGRLEKPEIARLIKFSERTVHRILSTLIEKGFMVKLEKGVYELTDKLYE